MSLIKLKFSIVYINGCVRERHYSSKDCTIFSKGRTFIDKEFGIKDSKHTTNLGIVTVSNGVLIRIDRFSSFEVEGRGVQMLRMGSIVQHVFVVDITISSVACDLVLIDLSHETFSNGIDER